MPGYLAHSESRFFLFFLECGAQGDEQMMDLVGVFFLSNLPAQIPDSSVVYSGHTLGLFLSSLNYFTT